MKSIISNCLCCYRKVVPSFVRMVCYICYYMYDDNDNICICNTRPPAQNTNICYIKINSDAIFIDT